MIRLLLCFAVGLAACSPATSSAGGQRGTPKTASAPRASPATVQGVQSTAPTGPSAATATPDVTIVEYRVRGETLASLTESLNANRPALGGFLGRTEWQLGVNATPAAAGDQCALSGVVVRVTITMRLPVRELPRTSDPTLDAQWARFSAALRAHEDAHAANARAARLAAERELTALRAPCGTIGARASEIIQRSTAQFQARDAEFDARTEHGVRDGAAWPPRAAQ
jgi:predicted secreted Zn-dependent protease